LDPVEVFAGDVKGRATRCHDLEVRTRLQKFANPRARAREMLDIVEDDQAMSLTEKRAEVDVDG